MTNRKHTKPRSSQTDSGPRAPASRLSPSPSLSPERRRSVPSRERRTRPWWRSRTPLVMTLAVVLIGAVAALVGVLAGNSPTSTLAPRRTTAFVSGPAGPEGVPLQQGPLLAPASTAATGQAVDATTVLINTADAKCTRAAALVDHLLTNPHRFLLFFESKKEKKQQHVSNRRFRCVVVSLLTKSINKFSASQEVINQ